MSFLLMSYLEGVRMTDKNEIKKLLNAKHYYLSIQQHTLNLLNMWMDTIDKGEYVDDDIKEILDRANLSEEEKERAKYLVDLKTYKKVIQIVMQEVGSEIYKILDENKDIREEMSKELREWLDYQKKITR